MCGEMAGEPLAIPILLGLGLDEFSMNATAIPEAKAVLRSLSLAEAEEIAAESLSLPSAEKVRPISRGGSRSERKDWRVQEANTPVAVPVKRGGMTKGAC
jgi:phosphoenolpyruvate-protein kinase (PTS system EI component)